MGKLDKSYAFIEVRLSFSQNKEHSHLLKWKIV